ncbi:MAG: ABC transporter permease, partial [Gammaproteobacteria bacterium]|nr:ABC transporter permease [Gammaproteobacteria bacterium]
MNSSVFWYALRQRQRSLGMILTLAIGVTALVAVNAFAERLSSALKQGAAEALGGQLVLSADHPIQEHFRTEATRLGLRSALSTTFPSMAIAAGRTHLVEVKAVSSEYPLLGELWVNGIPARAPAPGQAWLEPDALTALGLTQGANFSLGTLTLEVRGRLDREPDRAPSAFAIGPRVMIAAADLEASELLGFGSRATFRLHLTGEPAALQALADYVRKHPERGQRLEGLDEIRPQLRQALARAQSLLRGSALLALLLAGLAVGIALQARLRAQLDAAATLRALGASTRFITHATLLALLPTAVLGSLIGIALGYALQP